MLNFSAETITTTHSWYKDWDGTGSYSKHLDSLQAVEAKTLHIKFDTHDSSVKTMTQCIAEYLGQQHELTSHDRINFTCGSFTVGCKNTVEAQKALLSRLKKGSKYKAPEFITKTVSQSPMAVLKQFIRDGEYENAEAYANLKGIPYLSREERGVTNIYYGDKGVSSLPVQEHRLTKALHSANVVVGYCHWVGAKGKDSLGIFTLGEGMSGFIIKDEAAFKSLYDEYAAQVRQLREDRTDRVIRALETTYRKG